MIAPFELRKRFLELIEHRAVISPRKGKPARIIVKINALVDEEIIVALVRGVDARGCRLI